MMILQHNATRSWLADGPLAPRGATRLRARWAGRLAVCAGRVWVTRAGDPTDHVLEAGQTLIVSANDDVVVEPWRGGAPTRLLWRSDQPPALAARAFGALVAVVRRLSGAGRRTAGAC